MSTEKSPGRAIYARAMVTFTLLAAFAALAGSGLLMYGWRALGAESLLGLGRGEWNAVHTSMSFVVVLAAAFHLCLNWRAIVGYVGRKAGGTAPHLRECLCGVLLVGAVVAGTLLGLPPFSSIAPKEHHGPPPPGALHGAPDRVEDAEGGHLRDAIPPLRER